MPGPGACAPGCLILPRTKHFILEQSAQGIYTSIFDFPYSGIARTFTAILAITCHGRQGMRGRKFFCVW
jgi:hypothetical protein